MTWMKQKTFNITRWRTPVKRMTHCKHQPIHKCVFYCYFECMRSDPPKPILARITPFMTILPLNNIGPTSTRENTALLSIFSKTPAIKPNPQSEATEHAKTKVACRDKPRAFSPTGREIRVLLHTAPNCCDWKSRGFVWHNTTTNYSLHFPRFCQQGQMQTGWDKANCPNLTKFRINAFD